MSVIYDCDMNNPECFSPITAVPWETDFAALVPRFTGSLSAISSSLIMYVIMRSERRLSSIYHRIMFGMSIADICGSIAMALTSLPMPSYMPKEEIYGYHWAGTRLGNTYTCNAQGFFATFGMVCMFNYNAMLCLYYACAIALTMRERNIKKYVEPILHGLPILAGLAFSVPPLFYDMHNPGISAYAWCGPTPYPNECSVYENVECIRGDPKVTKGFQVLLLVVIMYVFCIIFVALGLVVWTVIQTDCVMAHISKMYCDRGYNDLSKVLEKHRNTKAVVIQAFSYITAFLLGVIPPLLLSVGAVDTSGNSQVETTNILEKLTLIFLPLQGFFNFIIFVSFKVYNYRRVRQDVSICRVIALLFSTSTHDPCFISRISIVMKTDDENYNFVEELSVNQSNNNQQHQVHEFDIHDESNDELHFRLGLMNEDPEVNSRNVQVDNAEILNSDIQSCHNGNSLLSFPSRSSSVTNNSSLWLGALSTIGDEGLTQS